MADLVRAGKVRHIGVSNVTIDEFERARGTAPIASVQNRFSLADRQHEALVDRCAETGTVFLPYGPLNAEAFARGAPLAAREGRLGAAAPARGCTPAQLALAWLLARSPALLPIPGTTLRRASGGERGCRSHPPDARGSRRARRLRLEPSSTVRPAAPVLRGQPSRHCGDVDDEVPPAWPFRPAGLGADPGHHDLRRSRRRSPRPAIPRSPGARRLVDRCIDAGINLFDTANVYSCGRLGGDPRRGARRQARRAC